MNKYIFPVYDKDYAYIYIEKITARSLKAAFETLSEIYELNNICENQEEFNAAVSEIGLIVGELIDIDELNG